VTRTATKAHEKANVDKFFIEPVEGEEKGTEVEGSRFTIPPTMDELLAPPRVAARSLIHDFLLVDSISVLYGPPGGGKSLLALLMSWCIAAGQPFAGLETSALGLVVYIALEGNGLWFHDRMRALRNQYPEALHRGGDRLRVLETAMDMRNSEKSGDAEQLITMLKALGRRTGEPIALIVIDTLAQVIGDGDENAGKVMNPVYQNASAIKRATGASVMFVGHTGKDEGKGLRGWSGQTGHIETLLFVKEGVVTVERQRNVEKMQHGLGFEVRKHTVGVDEKGREQTADVVVMTGKAKAKPNEGSFGPTLRRIVDALVAVKEEMTAKGIVAAVAQGGHKLTVDTVRVTINTSMNNNAGVFTKRDQGPGKAVLYGLAEWSRVDKYFVQVEGDAGIG
jgi:AAA domain